MQWLTAVLARCLPAVLAAGLAIGAVAPARAEPPTTHEILSERPSGFWTSNRPAVGGAYRWRLLGIGVVLVAATGYAMLRLIRRASAERALGGAAHSVAHKQTSPAPDD